MPHVAVVGALIVVVSIASPKTILTDAVTAILVAASEGVVEETMGAVVSVAPPPPPDPPDAASPPELPHPRAKEAIARIVITRNMNKLAEVLWRVK